MINEVLAFNCYVAFTIEKNGDLTGVRVLTEGLSDAQIEKAKTIIKKMPNWQPAHSYGHLHRSKQVIVMAL